jgi:HAE1 family hydrophobic/amphiphilic exporter-1
LVLAIGLVVDDAIVVVEAVERHIQKGIAPKEATLKAMQEITGPVIGVALVLAAVFVPTAFSGNHWTALPTVCGNDCRVGPDLGV